MSTSNPQTVSAGTEDGEIVVEEPKEQIADAVIDGQIVILKNVFDPDKLRSLRKDIFEWAQETPETSKSTETNESTFHSIDNNPKESSNPKVYHSFNFVLSDTDNYLNIDHSAEPYFEKLRDLQNSLASTDGDFGDLNGLAMRPIILHYPRGGGGFPVHTHPYLPQKIGVILSMSEYGEDYQNGGTRFALPTGEVVDIEGEHTIGDIALFRVDLPHSVTPCDPESKLEFNDIGGRWSMILPYNRF